MAACSDILMYLFLLKVISIPTKSTRSPISAKGSLLYAHFIYFPP